MDKGVHDPDCNAHCDPYAHRQDVHPQSDADRHQDADADRHQDENAHGLVHVDMDIHSHADPYADPDPDRSASIDHGCGERQACVEIVSYQKLLHSVWCVRSSTR